MKVKVNKSHGQQVGKRFVLIGDSLLVKLGRRNLSRTGTLHSVGLWAWQNLWQHMPHSVDGKDGGLGENVSQVY